MIAPSSPFKMSSFQKVVRWLTDRGYRVKFRSDIFTQKGYLAGNDSRRRLEFIQAWNDSKASAIFVARGGFGSIRIFGKQGINLSKASPKIFMGMSDLTVLLNYISKTTGIVTIHGPVMAGELFESLGDKERDQLFSQLESSISKILNSSKDYQILMPGNAVGRLFGGNLTMIQSTLGTPFEIPFDDTILFLEEINEPLYRIDRMFAHLSHYGALKKIRALLLGDFYDVQKKAYSTKLLLGVVKRYLPNRKIPLLGKLKVGHRHMESLLPIGGIVKIESQGKRIVISSLVETNSKRSE